jgi:hypothetical protein
MAESTVRSAFSAIRVVRFIKVELIVPLQRRETQAPEPRLMRTFAELTVHVGGESVG